MMRLPVSLVLLSSCMQPLQHHDPRLRAQEARLSRRFCDFHLRGEVGIQQHVHSLLLPMAAFGTGKHSRLLMMRRSESSISIACALERKNTT
jgi:hypothetical protein